MNFDIESINYPSHLKEQELLPDFCNWSEIIIPNHILERTKEKVKNYRKLGETAELLIVYGGFDRLMKSEQNQISRSYVNAIISGKSIESSGASTKISAKEDGLIQQMFERIGRGRIITLHTHPTNGPSYSSNLDDETMKTPLGKKIPFGVLDFNGEYLTLYPSEQTIFIIDRNGYLEKTAEGSSFKI